MVPIKARTNRMLKDRTKEPKSSERGARTEEWWPRANHYHLRKAKVMSISAPEREPHLLRPFLVLAV